MTAAELYILLRELGVSLRVDDETDRLIVSPGDLLTDGDRSAIRRHKAELMAMASIDTGAGEDDDPSASPPHPCNGRTHATPSRCLGPTACGVLGICGREECLAAGERRAFERAVLEARSVDNPHRVPHGVDGHRIAA